MDFIFPVIFAILVIGLIALLILSAAGTQKQKDDKKKDRQTILRDANRKLAQDPHSPTGLKSLADLYFNEHVWEKAFPLYNLMLDISAAHPQIDVLTTGLRQGICAIKMNNHAEAFKGLALARKVDPNNGDVNFYFGQAFYFNNDFEKAIPLLKRTIVTMPENHEAYKFLGLALARARKFHESLSYLKHALDNNPEDKEVMFTIAQSLAETNSIERAIRIFSHLRADPEFGARSCLQAGTLHASSNQVDRAIQDFEIGLKHTNAPVETAVDIRYRLAQAYLKQNRISDALAVLNEIQTMLPNYKDVAVLITGYQELNQNKNLQVYLIANSSDFVALCKEIVMRYFKDGKTRIMDITAAPDNTEIVAEIETSKWSDVIIFRFYRASGVTGELFIRDFHSRIRDLKAGRGICFSAGTYSDEARKYIDGRPIDLIERSQLTKFLSSITKKSPDVATMARAASAVQIPDADEPKAPKNLPSA